MILSSQVMSVFLVVFNAIYLLFGGLFPRPPPEALPGFLLGALGGTGVFGGVLCPGFFVAIFVSISCQLPAGTVRQRRGFPDQSVSKTARTSLSGVLLVKVYSVGPCKPPSRSSM